MKKCKTCSTEDPANFYETQGSLYCKPCHKEKYFAPGRARLRQAKLDRVACVDCNLIVTENTLPVFDFDHLGNKEFNVSQMTTCSNERFETEIAKCELRCANCHRLKTKREPTPHPVGGRPRRNILNWSPF
jgi:hypothetical protein